MKSIYQTIAALALGLPLAALAQCETPEAALASANALKQEQLAIKATQEASLKAFLLALDEKERELKWTPVQRKAFLDESGRTAEYAALQLDMTAQKLKVLQVQQELAKPGVKDDPTLACTIGMKFGPPLREVAAISAKQMEYLRRRVDEAK